jgi:hypothetical protein
MIRCNWIYRGSFEKESNTDFYRHAPTGPTPVLMLYNNFELGHLSHSISTFINTENVFDKSTYNGFPM